MKVDAIRNCRLSCPAQKIRTCVPNSQRGASLEYSPKCDTVSFKNCAVLKGAGWGAAVGLGGLALLSFISGGLAAPAAFGVYAAMGGTVGSLLGDINESDKAINQEVN